MGECKGILGILEERRKKKGWVILIHSLGGIEGFKWGGSLVKLGLKGIILTKSFLIEGGK